MEMALWKIPGMEDSSMIIEFLRAERSVSQTARQRADELAERAEKATAAVRSILENQGISDASEEFDSGSDSKGAESTDNRNERNTTSSNVKPIELRLKASTMTFSFQEWKKYTDSAWRRSSSFASSGTSSRIRAGKSCRRIRRSNTKSATDELQNTSGECPHERLPSFANNVPQSLMDSAGNNDVKDQLHFPASETSENRRKTDESDENMERALQHKRQLIGQYEAEEKAQREWEEIMEKDMSNHDDPLYGKQKIHIAHFEYSEISSYAGGEVRKHYRSSKIGDSCDPGNYSDVTEERDDGQPYTSEMTNLQNKFQEADNPSTNGVTDNFPSTPNCSRIINSEPSASEFALSKSNGTCPENNGPPSFSVCEWFPYSSIGKHSLWGSESQAGQVFEGAYEQTLVSRDASDNIGFILGALERAKFSINQQINVSPVAKGGSSIEYSIPTTRIEDGLGIPPTDFQPSRRPILENTLGTEFDYLNPPSSLGLQFSSGVGNETSHQIFVIYSFVHLALARLTSFFLRRCPDQFACTLRVVVTVACALGPDLRLNMLLEFFKDLYLKNGDLIKNIIFQNKDQEDEAHQIFYSEKSSSDDETLKYKNIGIDESQLKNERFKVKTPQVQSTGVGAKASSSK
ncbi:hypothetical protein RND71_028932 [Anisodus tanguticus]|uniref:Uncharacterized protein n=1 Tax=Anisodus tanguticus TaxID=243964 RepID=A0AAE1RJ96_9SOLA|nr:hypothetical protein RND71_028932 [Anisodus tanguticus]